MVVMPPPGGRAQSTSPSGFCGWEQTWGPAGLQHHTLPHHHHHVSQGRNHSNCWNLVSGDPSIFSKTVWFGMYVFPVRLLQYYWACSLSARQSINPLISEAWRHDLTHSFIYQLLLKEALCWVRACSADTYKQSPVLPRGLQVRVNNYESNVEEKFRIWDVNNWYTLLESS